MPWRTTTTTITTTTGIIMGATTGPTAIGLMVEGLRAGIDVGVM
jgi:hypothetical protein